MQGALQVNIGKNQRESEMLRWFFLFWGVSFYILFVLLGRGETPASTRGYSMRERSTQSRKGCREGRRPFAGAGQRPAGVKGQSPLRFLNQHAGTA